MFSVKIYREKSKDNFILIKMISKLSDYLKKDMNREVNIVSGSTTVEMVSGNLDTNNNEIVTELMFKKTITLNADDLNDKQKLDKYVKEIKHFCEQAAAIEDLEYLPLTFRK